MLDIPAVGAVKLTRQTGICVLTPFSELAGEGARPAADTRCHNTLFTHQKIGHCGVYTTFDRVELSTAFLNKRILL